MFFIPFCRHTSQKNVENLLARLKKPNAPNCVYVNSNGGTFEHFSKLAPSIERRGITTLSGNIASAGILISLLGYKRYALPGSKFYFHEIRAVFPLHGDFQEVTVSTLQNYLDLWVEIEALAAYGAGKEWLEEKLRPHEAISKLVRFLYRTTNRTFLRFHPEFNAVGENFDRSRSVTLWPRP